MVLILNKFFQNTCIILILYSLTYSISYFNATARSLPKKIIDNDFLFSLLANYNSFCHLSNQLIKYDLHNWNPHSNFSVKINALPSVFKEDGIIIAANRIYESIVNPQSQDVRKLDNRTRTNDNLYDERRIENDTAKKENKILSIKEVGDVHIVKIELEDYNSEISLNVFNLLGKKIMEVFKGKPRYIKDYPYEIPSWKLPNGVYICVLSGKDFRKTEKFIVAR